MFLIKITEDSTVKKISSGHSYNSAKEQTYGEYCNETITKLKKGETLEYKNRDLENKNMFFNIYRAYGGTSVSEIILQPNTYEAVEKIV